MDFDTSIKDLSLMTPDPERALKNLERLFKSAPEFFEDNLPYIKNISLLFSYSQFLADYCIRNPDVLAKEVSKLNEPPRFQDIISLVETKGISRPDMMRILRDTKKRYLLRITMRDILGITDIKQSMAELSTLAEAILYLSLEFSKILVTERYGDLNQAFSIIALGKLGARELNYSSDIDIITVYEDGDNISSGILMPSGIRANRVTSYEYFSKITETLSSLLSYQTYDGVAYRVDLRLRPNGQRGEITLPLKSYLSYYESYGKTWERMALIRGRYVVGDYNLGKNFIDAIEPFVWKRSIDYNDIEEIRGLKRRIDHISDINDIKRGYGGIREIEFFIHTFQLLYGGEDRALRSPNISIITRELKEKGIITATDAKTLNESYLFLRRIEHILQMRDDRQTHSLPTNPEELKILSRKMNFLNHRDFLSELKLNRLKVRDMYNSLFSSEEAPQQELMVLFDEELTDNTLVDYLSFKGFKDPNNSLKNIKILNEQMSFRRTIRERGLIKKIIPIFLDFIIKSENKDRALKAFVSFIEKTGGYESYMDLLSKRIDTVEAIVAAFSSSRYLTRIMMSLDNLEGIFEYPDIRMDYKSVYKRIINMLKDISKPMDAIREIRLIEELKTGLLFINKIIDIKVLSKGLTMLADTILRAVLNNLKASEDFAIIGIGRFGAREMTFGSDLDLLFISRRDDALRLAGEVIRFLSEYTDKGIAYKIDMGLRPDGSKGILVNDIEGYKDYYLRHAHLWEIQAILKARPVAGDNRLLRDFYNLKREVIIQRGKEVSGEDILSMRKRIIREISKRSLGIDIKHDYGGIEEIEFFVQYLQLKNASKHKDLIIHNSEIAIKRLARHGILSYELGDFMIRALSFFRIIESLMRLNEEDALKFGSETYNSIVRFLGFKSGDKLLDEINNTRQRVLEVINLGYI